MLRLALLYGAILVVGVFVWSVAENLGATRLPGDVVVTYGTSNLTIPFTTAIILTLIAAAALWVIRR